ncbi:MAG: carbonic anhydrase [Ignavibacteria bacterium]
MRKLNSGFIISLITVFFVFISGTAFSQEGEGGQSLKKLMEGNKRYLSGSLKPKDFSKERAEQSGGQNPYAIILSCSDSRVPPEIIFDEDLGDLFIIRVAGNVIDEVTLGSIEYAAEHLHTPMLLVLGHSKCGAVKASLGKGDFGKNIGSIVKRIKPAVEHARKENQDEEKILPASVEFNVINQIGTCVKSSKIIKELEHEGKFKIVGGVYDIDSGQFNRIIEK